MVADLRSLSCEERTYRQSIHGPRDRSARACSIALAVFGSSQTRTHVIQVRTRLPQAAVDDAASGQARSPSHPKLASSQALHHSSHNNHLYHNNLSTPSSPHSHQASSVSKLLVSHRRHEDERHPPGGRHGGLHHCRCSQDEAQQSATIRAASK
jgi:hypothetical protein